MADFLHQVQTLLDNRYWRVTGILTLALALALLLRILVMPLLSRAVRRTSSTIDDHILDRVGPAAMRTVVLVGIYWALTDLVHDPTLDFYLRGLVVTLLTLIWGRVVVDSVAMVLRRASLRTDQLRWIQPQTMPLFLFGLKLLVFTIQVYIFMSAWRFNLTSWLASAGVVGIAVGFAAKDTLANFISGIFILADAPYQVGQYIIIDQQTRGVVTDIGMRSTRLLTRDNVEITVPNAVIGNSMVVNQSSGPSPRMRVRVTASVPYGSDVDQVRAIFQECGREVPFTCADQETVVRFSAMGDSALVFTVMVWVENPEYQGRVVDILNTRIYKALGVAGIEIPFPQQDVHIRNWPGPPSV